jgi:hypothetical protein
VGHCKEIPGTGIEPARPKAPEPKSGASTNSAIPAFAGRKVTKILVRANQFCKKNSLTEICQAMDAKVAN